MRCRILPWLLLLLSSRSSGVLVERASAAVVQLVLGGQSPLRPLALRQAKKTMVSTAASVGIEWQRAAESLRSTMELSEDSLVKAADGNQAWRSSVPPYYMAPFHAYDNGNLDWDAAIEQEIASKAVGARNYPSYGVQGEGHFRGLYVSQMQRLGVEEKIPQEATLVDIGCGVGLSTRVLADQFPSAKRILGLDLSPHMIAVARNLQHLARKQESKTNKEMYWVNDLKPQADARLEYRFADGADTKLQDESVDMVSICLVVHELPAEATRDMLKESYRILKPNGVLCLMEMDGNKAPGYRNLRRNPLLYSLISSTEPYLDEYFRSAEDIPSILADVGFREAVQTSATGRHFVIAAYKGEEEFATSRFDAEFETLSHMRYLDLRSEAAYLSADEHLQTWQRGV